MVDIETRNKARAFFARIGREARAEKAVRRQVESARLAAIVKARLPGRGKP